MPTITGVVFSQVIYNFSVRHFSLRKANPSPPRFRAQVECKDGGQERITNQLIPVHALSIQHEDLIGMYSLLTFNKITDMFGHKSTIFLLVFYLSLQSFILHFPSFFGLD